MTGFPCAVSVFVRICRTPTTWLDGECNYTHVGLWMTRNDEDMSTQLENLVW